MEIEEYIKKSDRIYQTVFNPYGKGVVRIHLIPPKKKKVYNCWLAVLDEYYVLPLESSYGVLLREFLRIWNQTDKSAMNKEALDVLIDDALVNIQKIYDYV